MHTKVIRCQPYNYAFSVLSFILSIPQQTQASVIKLLVSLSLLILNMITFIYILNICEYDVSNMYIIYTCMLCILLSLAISLSNIYSKGKGYKLSNTEEKKYVKIVYLT